MIDPAEADAVHFIFHHFINGDRLGKISDALARMGIASPTGRATWSRETISKLLANEKYVGDVVLGKTNVIDGVQVKSHDVDKLARSGGVPVITPQNAAQLNEVVTDMIEGVTAKQSEDADPDTKD